MKLLILILTPLLLLIELHAQPITGTSLGHYSKPGAPIDIKYTVTRVETNETADVNITLIPTVYGGVMNVLLTIDDKLKQLSSVEKEIKFEITQSKRAYPINLQVSSEEDGLYYIRLLTKIEKGRGSKMRAFAIPVSIGKGKQSNFNTIIIRKPDNLENISVSRAIETIRVLK
jgi:hypothetical protein